MSGEVMQNKMLISVRFEVFGKVQGVFFRKHTREAASKLGLRGFVQNTNNGTVIGILEGEKDKILEMKNWLTKVGSPQSRIDKCVFSDEKEINKAHYKDFSINR